MKKYKFFDLEFIKNEDKLLLTKFGPLKSKGYEFVDITLSGRNKNSHMGSKIDNSSEGRSLNFKDFKVVDHNLFVSLYNDLIEVNVLFKYLSENCYQIETKVKNTSSEDINIEELSTIKVVGFDKVDFNKIKFTKFVQSHQNECLVETSSLSYLKISSGSSQRMIQETNIGSWSTKQALPKGIINYGQNYVMFDIYSTNAWHYEISEKIEGIYLSLGYPTSNNGGFEKTLKPNEEFSSLPVRLVFGKSLTNVVNGMNKVYRLDYKPSVSDKELPVIFNEYMHLSWDSPFEKRTLELAPLIKSLGAKYYVIDCGWHNEEPGDKIYPFVGQWMESNARFPRGIKFIKEYLTSLGLKLGLWIEPEIIGYQCKDMLEYYDDDCFLKRNGKKIITMNRMFLDYRNPKVVDYMEKTITRMVEEYGADYIKYDYNEDIGIGVDDPDCYLLGYVSANDAFLNFIERMTLKYPEVVFEGCASGGMRMDSKSVAHYSLVSTSDQTIYLKYPYIVGNLFTTVLPEQGAVWSYPVCTYTEGFTETKEFVNEHTSDSEVVINMVNGLLGRMHLASHIELLNEHKQALVKEGIDYYNSIVNHKINADIVLPNGFSHFGDKVVTVGLKKDKKIILGVWSLINDTTVSIDLKETIKKVNVGYPNNGCVNVTSSNTSLCVNFKEVPYAAVLEIEVE